MKIRHHLVTAVVVSFTVLLLGAASASGNSFSVSETDFAMSFSAMTIASAFGEVSCPVTLAGSFHENTLAKSGGALIGHITNASIDSESCEGGSASFLAETLPWHVQYEGFEGSLPNISAIDVGIVGLSAQATISGTTCLIRTESATPIGWRIDVSVRPPWIIILVRWVPDYVIPITGGFLCELAGDAEASGEETAIEDGEEGQITLSLT